MIDYYLEAYNEKIRKARKEHKCCECLGVIQKGEKYHYGSGIGEDGPESYKFCLDCYSLRDEINSHISFSDDQDAFGELCEYAMEDNNDEYLLRFKEICAKRNSPMKFCS